MSEPLAHDPHDHDPCCDHEHPGTPAAPPKRPSAAILRFLSWFIAFSGLYAMGSVCPFCGRAGCPVGGASAGLVGLVFASLMQWGQGIKAAMARIRRS